MTELKKFRTDPEDYDILIKDVEESFEIKFEKKELHGVKTFGELSDIILSKINLPNVNDSTPQQAFYKLRKAISVTKNIDSNEIRMETKLRELFPRKGRKKAIRALQFELGFDLKVLRPYLIIEAFFLFALIGLIITLFFSFIDGLKALALLILLINFAFKTGKEFNCETVGDLAAKIVKDKNKKPKKDSVSFSEEEIIEELKFLFGKFHPSEEEITRETKI